MLDALRSPSYPRPGRILRTIATGVLLALAATAFPGLPIPSARAQTPADVAKGLERFIVKIFPAGQTSGPFAGTGFVVRAAGERTLIATSLAVAARLDRVTVADVAGARFEGAVSLRHAPTQVALISVSGWTGPRIVDIDPRPLQAQETVVVLGFDRQSGGGAFVTTRASSGRKLAEEMPPGFEGGPVVGLDQRILGLVGSLQGDVVPSASILEALAPVATAPGATPAPPPGAPGINPAAGGMAIRSFPTRAEISWAGQPLTRTPATIERRPGMFPLRFSLANHVDVGMQVPVTARTHSVYVVLPPQLRAGYGRTPFARNKIRDGLAALAAGDGVGAARLFRQGLDSDYTLVELRVFAGLSYYLQGRFGDAITFLRDYVAVRSTGPFAMAALAVMGLSFEQQGRFQDALTRYKLALRLHPALAQVPATPVTDAELRTLESTAKQQPARHDLAYRLGIAYEAKGRFREGMQAFKDALFALDPP